MNRAQMIAAAVACVTCAAVGYAAREDQPLVQFGDDAPATVLPVVRVPTNQKMVEFRLFNLSTSTIRYLKWDGPSPEHLWLSLAKDGERLDYTILDRFPVDRPSGVDLRPDRSVRCYLDLTLYYNLKPGRYEVWAKYELGPDWGSVQAHDLTPMHFQRLVALLDIYEEREVETLPRRGGVALPDPPDALPERSPRRPPEEAPEDAPSNP
jgi:hypothetical protein